MDPVSVVLEDQEGEASPRFSFICHCNGDRWRTGKCHFPWFQGFGFLPVNGYRAFGIANPFIEYLLVAQNTSAVVVHIFHNGASFRSTFFILGKVAGPCGHKPVLFHNRFYRGPTPAHPADQGKFQGMDYPDGGRGFVHHRFIVPAA